MARTRQQVPGADWSCPLCTLLNVATEDRCAACDNKRPPVDQMLNSQPPEAPTVSATASSVKHVYRPAVGVFFSSSVDPQGVSGSATDWRHEPRLTVNRRRGNRHQEATTERENKHKSEKSETGGDEQVTASIGAPRAVKEDKKVGGAVVTSDDALDQWVEAEKQHEEQEEMEEEEDTAMDVEEPCFNLLGLGASVFGDPATDDVADDFCTTDETKSREESEEVDADDDMVVDSSSPRYPGFMPASRVWIEEPAIEKKLASAGLDLSDTDDEEEKPKHLGRKKEKESWEDKWVCRLCTHLNDQTAMACSSCMCKRYRDTPRSSEIDTGSTLNWACHICTNLNPPELTECEACMTNRRVNTQPSNSSSDEGWSCSVCTKINAPGTTQCEICESIKLDEPKKAPGKSRECPVCTNFNAPGSTRCDLCDSSLQPEEVQDDHFVDLSSSPVIPPARKSSYNFDESELENPYADLSQYDDYAAFNEAADAGTDLVEEISDNEVVMPLHNSRPVNARADLKEFTHFVCMEDLHSDYGCRINYNKMFAGQRSHKSYADRLAARQTKSRKRKRDAARKASGEPVASASRGNKAVRGSKKRKTAAAPRRGTKTTKAKRSRKKTAPARRASSVTTYSSGINHYDDTAGADLGEDISTMAWEGVGSAGYR